MIGIIYGIVVGNIGNVFEIDKIIGVIIIVRKLDREIIFYYCLIVSVID